MILLVSLGRMLTFLHASWVGEKTCRAKSSSVGEKGVTGGDGNGNRQQTQVV